MLILWRLGSQLCDAVTFKPLKLKLVCLLVVIHLTNKSYTHCKHLTGDQLQLDAIWLVADVIKKSLKKKFIKISNNARRKKVPMLMWMKKEKHPIGSYPTGNTWRHMGQLCSPPPAPPPAPPSSFLPHPCTSSSFLASTSFCRGTLSDTFTQYVGSFLLTGPVAFLPSSFPALENPGDGSASSQLCRDGRRVLLRVWGEWVELSMLWEDGPLTGGSGTALVCAVGSSGEELSPTGSGIRDVLRERWDGSGKVETSLLRSHHPCSSTQSPAGL